MGGAGRAKGFGGPVAPALSSALALGEGGGRTTPDEWDASVLVLAGVAPVVLASLGEPEACVFSASECSSGICTLRRGLLASELTLPTRAGGGIVGSDEVETVR